MFPLPLPLLLLAGAIIGAGMFWLRGSALFHEWTGRGATTARILWGASMGAVAWLAGHAAVDAAVVGALFFAGATPPWWRSLALGRAPGDGGLVGIYARHFARGLVWPGLAALYLIGGPAASAYLAYGGDFALHVAMESSGWVLVLAGAMCVPCYEIGWQLRPPGDARRPNATEIGELAFGAAQGAAVALSAP